MEGSEARICSVSFNSFGSTEDIVSPIDGFELSPCSAVLFAEDGSTVEDKVLSGIEFVSVKTSISVPPALLLISSRFALPDIL